MVINAISVKAVNKLSMSAKERCSTRSMNSKRTKRGGMTLNYWRKTALNHFKLFQLGIFGGVCKKPQLRGLRCWLMRCMALDKPSWRDRQLGIPKLCQLSVMPLRWHDSSFGLAY
jgi:hypothetical protein